MFIRFNKIVTIPYIPGIQRFGMPGTCLLSIRAPLCVEKDLEVMKKVVPLHSRLRNGGLKVLQKTVASAPSGASREKKSKNFSETLAGLKKMRTFAAPFEKRVLERGIGKFIEKTDYCTRSKYREKIQFIEKR